MTFLKNIFHVSLRRDVYTKVHNQLVKYMYCIYFMTTIVYNICMYIMLGKRKIRLHTGIFSAT